MYRQRLDIGQTKYSIERTNLRMINSINLTILCSTFHHQRQRLTFRRRAINFWERREKEHIGTMALLIFEMQIVPSGSYQSCWPRYTDTTFSKFVKMEVTSIYLGEKSTCKKFVIPLNGENQARGEDGFCLLVHVCSSTSWAFLLPSITVIMREKRSSIVPDRCSVSGWRDLRRGHWYA